MKIELFDRKNTDRLLGTIEYNGPLTAGRHHRFAVMPSTSFYARHHSIHTDFRTVDVKVTTKGDREQRQVTRLTRQTVITEKTVLITDAPLADLMKLKEFTLPKESVDEKMRRTRDEMMRKEREYLNRNMQDELSRRYTSIFGDY